MAIESIFGHLFDWAGLANIPASIAALRSLTGDVGQVVTITEVGTGNSVTRLGATDPQGQTLTCRPAALTDGEHNVLAINHRGYSAVAPENTLPAYILSKEKGFNYVEADVSFTSDGVAVLLHDDTIDRTSNGSGSISAMTYAQVSQYDFGSWKSADYAGTKIPTFEEFIVLCKRIGLHPYIELKQNGSYTAAQIRSLVELVETCGMTGKVTWISFSAPYLRYVMDADPYARLGYLVTSVTSSVISAAQGLQTGSNEVFIDSYDYDADAVSLCRNADLPLEIWTINSTAAIESMPSYITGVTSDSLIAGEILRGAVMGSVSGWTDGKFYFDLRQGQMMETAATGYINSDKATRVSYVGTACTVTPGARYRLVGLDGVRYGVNTILSSGYAKITNGMDIPNSTEYRLDSGWQTTGYEFTADASAACIWLTASFEAGDIIPEQAMPVYLEQIAGGNGTGWTDNKFYFSPQQGQIEPTPETGYLNPDKATRVSYVGTVCTVAPGARYRLVGRDGVRYGIQTLTTAGYDKVKGGQYIDYDPVYRLDSGWQATGYEFTADASAACIWLTASFETGDITPDQAMPVYLERLDGGNSGSGSILSVYSGKSISILGDSISTFTGYNPTGNAVYYTGSSAGVSTVQDTWWWKLMTALGMQLCINNSWSGSRVTTTDGTESAGCMSRCENLGENPDVIIVYLGINDFNNEVALGTYDGTGAFPTDTTSFREAYAIMLDKILTKYNTAEVWVCTLPPCERNGDNVFPEANENGELLAQWNEAIRELAALFGLNVLENAKCGLTYHNMSVFMGDYASGEGLHPNAYGHSLIANNAIRQMDAAVRTRYAINS